jgi:hypothetical protein
MNQKLAVPYIGKHLLIGVTYLDHDDSFIEQKQIHGNILRINEEEGIVIQVSNSDEEYKLPPDLNSLQEAPKGEFHLHSTGEVVVDPDLLTTWTITKPKPEGAQEV